jgi:hypothetical protein
MRQLYVAAIVAAQLVLATLLASGLVASNGPVWP